MTPLRRVLMVSPHFPPDSSAAAHRVRLLATHLPAAGWRPTVVTVDPAGYEGRLDRDLEALVPPTIEVTRARTWDAGWTRRFGIGDLGLRAFTGLARACRKLLARERFDLLFITVYPVYPALLGPRLKSEFRLPFVLDYQDPWVGAWGATVGGGPNGTPDWKSRASRQLGIWLEPRAVSSADALVAVSQGTLDQIVERIPTASQIPSGVVPLGFEPADFAGLQSRPRPMGHFDRSDGCVHLSYVGTLLPTGTATLDVLLRGLAKARHESPAAANLRLHFFGTSNQSLGDRHRVMPLARQYGLEGVVTEVPGRLDYLDALSVLTSSSAILLLGSSEPHYTASKLYPALLSRRPIFALFHERSSVVSILGDIACEPSIRVVTYGDVLAADAVVAETARHLSAMATVCVYNPLDVDLARADAVSARRLAADLARVFDRVAA